MRYLLLWLKAYKLTSLLGTSIVLAAALAAAGTRQLPVLSLRSPVTRHVAVAALVPLIGAVALCRRSDPGLGEIERAWPTATAVRRTGFAVVAGTIVVAALTPVLADPTNRLFLQVLRNFAGLCGLGLLACVAGGASWSWSLPVGYCVVALTLGVGMDGHVAAWAWLLSRRPTTASWEIAGILGAAGTVAFLSIGPRHRSGEEPA